MKDLFTLPDKILGVFTGSGVTAHFWVYWSSTFMDLMLSLLSAVLFYNTAKSFCLTRKAHGGCWSQPINIYKGILLCVSLIVFLRVSIDTIILLTWQEIGEEKMAFWQLTNQIFDILAFFPFIGMFYILLRAGPVIEFQLLRQPIPTDLHPSWRMVRTPVISIIMVVLLSLLVVSTKLLP